MNSNTSTSDPFVPAPKPEYFWHPDPTDPDAAGIDTAATIWRYMDLAKFLSLMSRKELYFARLDKLGDRFEGSMPKLHAAMRAEMFKGARQLTPLRPGDLDELQSARLQVQSTLVSCWHLNGVESAAMWAAYSSRTQGIAISSTVGRLVGCFPTHEGGPARVSPGADGWLPRLFVRLALVKYIDYQHDQPSARTTAAWKRKSFEHERELRAVVADTSIHHWPRRTRWHLGDGVPIDVTNLIDRVFVAPNAEPWFKEVVLSAVKAYGYQFEVVQSDLNQDPIY